ncbi:MAG: hypothetical protein U0163_06360 [Gemmatimonadaceae bacterium]
MRTTIITSAIAASALALSACSTDHRAETILGPSAAAEVNQAVTAAPKFDCVQTNPSRPYAVYHARGLLKGNEPVSTRVFRPYMGDTLSVRKTPAFITPAKYPGYPLYNVWNVTGGPAQTTNDLFLLLFPPSLPGPGGMFPAELHVYYNRGQWGWMQALEMCTVY